jgi:polyphenol oxidase
MEAKKWGLVLGIITIVAAFTRILHILEAPEVQHALLG